MVELPDTVGAPRTACLGTAFGVHGLEPARAPRGCSVRERACRPFLVGEGSVQPAAAPLAAHDHGWRTGRARGRAGQGDLGGARAGVDAGEGGGCAAEGEASGGARMAGPGSVGDVHCQWGPGLVTRSSADPARPPPRSRGAGQYVPVNPTSTAVPDLWHAYGAPASQARSALPRLHWDWYRSAGPEALLGDVTGRDVAELGAGSARQAAYVAQVLKPARVIALDSSATQHDRAVSLYGDVPRLELVRADAATYLAEHPDTLDVAYSIFGAVDFRDPETLLPAIAAGRRAPDLLHPWPLQQRSAAHNGVPSVRHPDAPAGRQFQHSATVGPGCARLGEASGPGRIRSRRLRHGS